MSAKNTGLILWALLAMFFLRAIGQIVVAIWAPSFLLPMEAWYSGLMPYYLLLPSQILILVVFSKIANDLSRARGYWFIPKKGLGTGLLIFGGIYFVGMVVRYFLQGISIPVVFHWVLANFVLVLGWYHRRGAR